MKARHLPAALLLIACAACTGKAAHLDAARLLGVWSLESVGGRALKRPESGTLALTPDGSYTLTESLPSQCPQPCVTRQSTSPRPPSRNSGRYAVRGDTLWLQFIATRTDAAGRSPDTVQVPLLLDRHGRLTLRIEGVEREDRVYRREAD